MVNGSVIISSTTTPNRRCGDIPNYQPARNVPVILRLFGAIADCYNNCSEALLAIINKRLTTWSNYHFCQTISIAKKPEDCL